MHEATHATRCPLESRNAGALIALMSAIPTTVLPKLAPPGAGLPKLELMVAKLIFQWEVLRSSRDQAAATFSLQQHEIQRLVTPCDAATASQRVLIDRLRGLEDSSRNWSIFMTLDHLRIVNDAIADAITLLLAGKSKPSSPGLRSPATDDDGDLLNGHSTKQRARSGLPNRTKPIASPPCRH